MMEAMHSSETPVLTAAAQRNIPEDGILLSHICEKLKCYIALTGWALLRKGNVSPVRYILEGGFVRSGHRENLKSHIALTGWTL
jgi:hypothetical protein